MITHFLKTVNWIDVALVILWVRMVFLGVKNGFLSEFFKFMGVVVAVFVSLHFYSFLAAWLAGKTNVHWPYWDLVIFALLWAAAIFFFKLLGEGLIFFFKAETNHQGFDQYAAGALAIGRGVLVCSLSLFLILLTLNGPLIRMALHSYTYKITSHASVNTYSFLYHNIVGKFFTGERYNTEALKVLHPESK